MSTQTARRRPASAQRRRPSRRGPARHVVVRRRVVAVLVLLAVTAVVCAVWFTPLLGVRRVEVLGTTELTADQVRRAAAIEEGAPLVRLDVDAVVGRVRELSRVAGVRVERELPGTVRLTIDERTPVAVVKLPDGAHLVDATGRDYATLEQPPGGLPELQAEPAGTPAAVAVLTGLPEELRREVLLVTATTGSDVKLALTAGREVRWGSSADTPRKAAVLQVLMTRDGTVFDVSSPELPTVAGG
ncbi:FtsQ-type POTRA domain-containing protein [Actinosynnema sp. NPDC047251]|uniref:Polypeptide-transport-associated domain protein FtsQ-type n=1 Tax=Saccharothrix espanaensis (strain ATCC 51144 / DSM 44229 / JCM 9112 / NBRC 15066 / NRRL 15764) TaxID=1179773 RepID=K0KC26_SACES|nr:FtsQ-type POTRA domain-containing protein [Saccharothrix espanaensis]CCH34143.1 Polypeptide-transport-associated domain protein FtsQ-type [Saccharothrix espanaensis DSM 44229]